MGHIQYTFLIKYKFLLILTFLNLFITHSSALKEKMYFNLLSGSC